MEYNSDEEVDEFGNRVYRDDVDWEYEALKEDVMMGEEYSGHEELGRGPSQIVDPKRESSLSFGSTTLG
jgi:hypothetical protein